MVTCAESSRSDLSLPSITVVIPTCDRAEYLRHALESCVRQHSDNLCILVSDNASTDQTADVIASFSDKRVKAINPGRRLGMSSHWEFAFDHVDTDYCVFIGDDDALLDHSISGMTEIIRSTGVKAIRWQKPAYHWPDHGVEAVRNMLKIRFGSDVTVVDAMEALRKVSARKAWYGVLPGIYHACVSVTALRLLKTRTEGLLFLHSIPDVWLCVMLATVIDCFADCALPLSLPGASARSNGASILYDKMGKQCFDEFNQESSLSESRILIGSPTTSIDLIVLDVLKSAAPYLAAAGKSLAVRDATFFSAALSRASRGSRHNWDAIVGDVAERVRLRPVWMKLYYDYILGLHRYSGESPSPRFGFSGGVLSVDSSLWGVRDSESASVLCSRILAGDAKRMMEGLAGR